MMKLKSINLNSIKEYITHDEIEYAFIKHKIKYI